MKLSIYSHFAESEWTGDTESIELDSDDLETIYRRFNRVDDADAEWLLSIGYELPSLSVGDVVTLGEYHYVVLAFGFKEISGDEYNSIKGQPFNARRLSAGF